MFLVDSHCHLDALNYETLHSDLFDVISKAQQKEVKHCLAVGTTLPGFEHLYSMTKDFDNISLSCGIHPLNMDEGGDITQLKSLASNSKVVALGETGLDYYYQKENLRMQQQLFTEHIQVARQLNKPVIVHTREARKDTLAILAQERAYDCRGVLHCFTEDKATAGKLLDLGFYISFSGIITFRNAEELRDVARYVPLDRILVETDSPYLAPVPYRGKENQPAYVRDVAEYMAVIKKVELEELAQITTNNFSTLFKVPLI